MDQDYEEAFELLYKYDEKTPTEGTVLKEEEAKSFYLEKINKLKEYHYKLKDYDIINIRKEDGHTSFAEMILTFEVDGQEHEVSETIDEWNGKAWIIESEDPFVNFRNGKMGFDLENAEPEFYFMD
ncbi:hypothetical protein [Piscibacillus salipiscarius]|nr:hypothetical protein [Piscibacillus salipiscarius]